MDLPKASPLRRDFGEIIKASEQAASLVRQLLAFSRRQVLRPVLTDLNNQVRELTTMLGRILGEDVELVTKLKPAVPKVLVDTAQLAQVVMNLAVNARDAMPRGGRLTIRTDVRHLDAPVGPSPDAVPAGTYAVLEVRDEGTGMSPEVVEHIFEPFFTTKGAGVGTGLGLATVYGIVRQSGGDIVVDSTVDEGTAFTILLPEGSESERVSAAPASLRPEPGSQERILLVEDERSVRKLARRILETRGYEVVEASSPEAAVKLAQGSDRPFHLVLTDVVMPGMTGFDLASQLRDHQGDLPVLYMTGYSYDELSTRGLPAIDVNLVDKPFTADALLRAVRKTLQGNPAEG